MATRIKEGMTGAEVAQIIDDGFDNLEELNQRVEINETALEDIKNMSFVSELMGIGTTKEEVNVNYRGISLGISFEFQRTIPSASSLNAGVMTAADKTKLDLVVTDGDGMQFLSDDGTYKTIADEEDITAEDGNLKLKDRAYDEASFSGKGYKILRKNIVEGKNILTLDIINESNTVYEIRYDFDLQEQTLVLPKEATLLFKGGSINNGIVQFNGGTIIGADKFEDCGNASFTGNWSKGLIMSFDDTPKWWNGTEWVAFASGSEEIPNFQAEVTSVETTDGQAEATVSLAEQKFSFTFAIPRGEKGDKGDTGSKGLDGKDAVLEDFFSSDSINGVQNKIIDARFNELENIVFPLEVTFTSNKSLLEYTGSNQSIELEFKITRREQHVTPDKVIITKDSSSIYSGTDFAKTVETTVNKKGNTSFNLEVIYKDLNVSKSLNVNMVLPMYFGFSSLTDIASLDITTLNKQSIKTSPNGTYILNNSVTGNYLWLCVPDNMTINKVTSSGFDFPIESYVTKSTSLGNYKCYRSSSQINQGDVTILIS